MRVLLILLLLVAGLMAYVRLAPTRVEDWHKMPALTGVGDYQSAGGFRVERQFTVAAAEILTAAKQRALATPRTRLIAGSVEDGLMTFETRSRVMGFPDYTSVAVNGDTFVIAGHLRYGQSDMGVNKARILGWLDALAPLTEPL